MTIEEEFLFAVDRLDEVAAKWLRQQGVADIALHMWPGPLGVGAIETHPMGCFEFVEGKRRAFIQPVLCGGAFTDIVVLVAWHPDQPGQWWTRHYTGVPLGVDQLDQAEIEQKPVLLQATPMDWLRAKGNGVCVFDFKMSAHALRCVPALKFDDAAFGRRVHDVLAQPPLRVPEIRIVSQKAA